MHPVDLAILGSYVAFCLWLGIYVSRGVTTFREYFVVAGRLTTPLLVCTLVSTYYGLDVLFGVSEVAYQEGVVGFFVYSRPYYLFILVAAFLVARRLKRHDFLSLPDVTGRFFGDGTRIVTAVASFLYSLPILAVMGLGVLLDVLFGIPFVWGVTLGAAYSLAYTVLGGLIADSLTDTVQFVLMCVTLGVAAWLALDQVGGAEAVLAGVPESFLRPTGNYPAGTLVVFVVTASSALVDPGLYQRIFAARSYRAVALALGLGLVLWSAFDWATTMLGMSAAASGLPIPEPRYALLEMTLAVLPVGLSGLFVVGVLATATSTIDTYLLICGGNVAYDIWRPLVGGVREEAGLLRLTRISMAGAAAITVGFALFFRSFVSAWVFMASLLVSTVLVPVLCGLYLRPPHARTAGFAAALGGLVVAFGFYIAVNVTGAYDPEWETVVAAWRIAGRQVSVWQEHAVLVALPFSAAAYAAGALWERGRR